MGILIRIAILVFLSNIVTAQIMDGNFEKWDTAFYWVLPINSQFELVPQIWKSNNEIHPDWNPFMVSTPASRTEKSYIGPYAAKVESMALGLDSSYSGWMYQDVPLERLSELSFWVNCDSLSGLSGCFIEVFGIIDSDNLKLIYQDSIMEENLDFFNYKIGVEDLISTQYDSIRLQFRAKGAGGFVGDDEMGHTIFIVDGVESNYLSSTIDERYELQIFPNPFNGKLRVNNNEQKILNFNIIDIYGRSIRSGNCDTRLFEIDLSDQSNGIYLAILELEDGSNVVKKIIKK